MSQRPLFHLRCLMEGISPPIWRSLQLPDWLTFGQLESLVRVSFGWEPGEKPTGVYEIVGRQLSAGASDPDGQVDGWKLRDWFRPGMRFSLHLDGVWQVTLQVAGLAELEPDRSAIRCIGGEQAAPPEGVGGPAGYQQLLKHPKQRGLWNPERFDLLALNAALEVAALSIKPIRTPKHATLPSPLSEGPGLFLQETDVQFDLHAYFVELETAYWEESSPAGLEEAVRALRRDDLLGLCMVYGLAAETVFRRAQLVAMLVGHLPEAIRLQVPYLDDLQYGLLRQVVDSPEGSIRFARADMLFSPYELYYFRDRLLLFPRTRDGEEELYMLPEIRDALRMDPMQSLSRTQLQNTNRRRILCGMFQYYGVMDMEGLRSELSGLLGETVDMDTVIVDVQELQDYHDAVTIGEHLVMHTALDPAAAEELWARQQQVADLPYRTPSLETLDLAGDWMFVEATNEAEILISFLESRYALNTGMAEGVAWELMHRFRWGEPLEQSLQLAGAALPHPDASAQQRFAELVADLWLHAPAWRYKGWSPADVRERALAPEHALSSQIPEPEEYGKALRLMSETTGEATVTADESSRRKTQDKNTGKRKHVGRVLPFPGQE